LKAREDGAQGAKKIQLKNMLITRLQGIYGNDDKNTCDVIEFEVTRFMSKPGKISEADLAKLEENIRVTLIKRKSSNTRENSRSGTQARRAPPPIRGSLSRSVENNSPLSTVRSTARPSTSGNTGGINEWVLLKTMDTIKFEEEQKEKAAQEWNSKGISFPLEFQKKYSSPWYVLQ
jgi:hypothetical protein